MGDTRDAVCNSHVSSHNATVHPEERREGERHLARAETVLLSAHVWADEEELDEEVEELDEEVEEEREDEVDEELEVE